MGRADNMGEDGKNALHQAIASLDQSLHAIQARLGSDFPAYAALAHPEPLSIAATQDLLGPDEVLVQFIEARKWLKDDRTPAEEAFAWFISKSEVRWVKIPFGPEALAEKPAPAAQSAADGAQGRGVVRLSMSAATAI